MLQGIHKRMVRFEKLIKNLFLTLHGHNIHCQQREQASSFHKLSVRPGYIILVWCVFFKPCTKLMLHCNHRSGHLKTDTKKAFSCCDTILKTGPAVSMRSELLTAHHKLGHSRCWQRMLCPCRVRNALSTFKTAPFFCVRPICYII
jgi:hypothetical protein